MLIYLPAICRSLSSTSSSGTYYAGSLWYIHSTPNDHWSLLRLSDSRKRHSHREHGHILSTQAWNIKPVVVKAKQNRKCTGVSSPKTAPHFVRIWASGVSSFAKGDNLFSTLTSNAGVTRVIYHIAETDPQARDTSSWFTTYIHEYRLHEFCPRSWK